MKYRLDLRGKPVAPRDPIDTAALKAARIEREMSMRVVAEELTRRCRRVIGGENYRHWEAGNCRPPKDARAALEALFGISLNVEE
jgi:hypothetical protein